MNEQLEYEKFIGAKRERQRRIMKDFVISEISAVDFPAQRGATMTIMKRRAQKETDMINVRKRVEQPKSFGSFEEACEHVRKACGCSRTESLARARTSYPNLYRTWEVEGDETVAKAVKRSEAEERTILKNAAHGRDLQAEVASLAKREGISHTEAYRRIHRNREAA